MTNLEIALYLMSHEEREMLIRYVLLYLQQYGEKNIDKAAAQETNDSEHPSQRAS